MVEPQKDLLLKKFPSSGSLQKIDKESVFKSLPWLKERNLPMITHNDLDGLLSALIMKKILGWELVGVYDLQDIWVSPEYRGSLEDAVYVDLDMAHSEMRSIGHHIISSEAPGRLNLNNAFGVDYTRYHEKYPLSTAISLLWLYDHPFPDDSLAKLFLLHADSTWKNYEKYRKNVTQWIKVMGYEEAFFPALDNPSLASDMNNYILPNTYGYNNQCSFDISGGKARFRQGGQSVQGYIDFLAQVMKVQSMEMPQNMVCRTKNKRMEIKIFNCDIDDQLKTLRGKMGCENSVLSYSLKYKDTLDITYSS